MEIVWIFPPAHMRTGNTGVLTLSESPQALQLPDLSFNYNIISLEHINCNEQNIQMQLFLHGLKIYKKNSNVLLVALPDSPLWVLLPSQARTYCSAFCLDEAYTLKSRWQGRGAARLSSPSRMGLCPHTTSTVLVYTRLRTPSSRQLAIMFTVPAIFTMILFRSFGRLWFHTQIFLSVRV